MVVAASAVLARASSWLLGRVPAGRRTRGETNTRLKLYTVVLPGFVCQYVALKFIGFDTCNWLDANSSGTSGLPPVRASQRNTLWIACVYVVQTDSPSRYLPRNSLTSSCNIAHDENTVPGNGSKWMYASLTTSSEWHTFSTKAHTPKARETDY